MSRTVKIILIVVGALVLVLVLGIVSCFGCLCYYYEQNKDTLEETGRRGIQEGRQFGENHTKDQCIDEGLRQAESCEETAFMCEAEAGIFLRACLEVAPPDTSFCDGVPPSFSIMDSARWALSVCAQKNRPEDQRCTRIVRQAQEYCQHPVQRVRRPQSPFPDAGNNPLRDLPPELNPSDAGSDSSASEPENEADAG